MDTFITYDLYGTPVLIPDNAEEIKTEENFVFGRYTISFTLQGTRHTLVIMNGGTCIEFPKEKTKEAYGTYITFDEGVLMLVIFFQSKDSTPLLKIPHQLGLSRINTVPLTKPHSKGGRSSQQRYRTALERSQGARK